MSLHDAGGHASRRLLKLRAGGSALKKKDVLDLWSTYLEGCQSAGCEPDLYDFGTWLAGSGSYSSCQPADVIW